MKAKVIWNAPQTNIDTGQRVYSQTITVIWDENLYVKKQNYVIPFLVSRAFMPYDFEYEIQSILDNNAVGQVPSKENLASWGYLVNMVLPKYRDAGFLLTESEFMLLKDKSNYIELFKHDNFENL